MKHITSEWENWKDVTVAHCLILLAILAIVIAVYAYVVSKRAKRNAESREMILRGQLLLNSNPAEEEEYNFNPLWSGRGTKDMFEQKQNILDNLPKAKGGTGDTHWGEVGDDLIYFRKIMANSYHVIDAHVSTSNVQHRQKSFPFVRDYLRILQKEFNGLSTEESTDLCEEYLKLYEEARFGDPYLKVGRKKFMKLEKAIFKIISACEETDDKVDTRRKRPRGKQKRSRREELRKMSWELHSGMH